MTVLVTGAQGFVGTALCADLQSRGIAHVAAVRATVGKIGPATDWRPILKGCDVVVHLAGLAHRPVQTDKTEMLVTNVVGTLRLAEQAAAAGVRRFVFLSSVKAWGETTEPGQFAKESDDCHPQDDYGTSKLVAEQGLRKIAQESGMSVVIIRPPLVYGPGVKANFAHLMRGVVRGWPLPLGLVRNARSFIALDNLVDFVICCIEHPAADNEIFHVSDGVDLSAVELVSGIARAAGVPVCLLPVPISLLRVLARLIGKADAVTKLTGNLQLDISKAHTLLGWRPPLSVNEGLRRAVTTMERPT